MPPCPRALALALAASAAILPGCPDAGPSVPDAPEPMDTPPDVPLPPVDAGPPCDLSCTAPLACCFTEGTPTCIDYASSLSHCGACGIDCVATRRGDGCALGRCTCGDIDIGCAGGITSVCCMSGTSSHCADFLHDFDDCGDCDAACDVATADRCDNGTCACGESGAACAPGTTCCPPLFGPEAASCVDTLTSQQHCGACGNLCSTVQVCRDGVCVSRADAGVDAGLDAGITDDAGPDDAGLDDAGADAP